MRPSLAVLFPVSLLLGLACGSGGAPEEPAGPAEVPASTGGAPTVGAAAAPAAEEAFTADRVPEDLRSGTADSRAAAVGRYESDPEMTQALIWVMQHDAADEVRVKAWRALRARWKRGTGDARAHEAAAVWAAAEGDASMRLEALAALGERSRDLALPAKHLADASPAVRTAAAEAVFAIGSRTGKRADAKKLLQDRLAVESAGALRKKLDGWIGGL